MYKKPKNIKELMLNISGPLLHDIDEIIKMQGATHSDVDAFVKAAYRKAFNDMRKGILSLDKYSKVSTFNALPFRSFEDKTFNASDIFSKTVKSIADISAEMGLEKSKNHDEITHVSVNPISNIPSYVKGVQDFCIDVAVSKGENGVNIHEVYSYNPISHEMFYGSVEGLYVNDYRFMQAGATSDRSLVSSISLKSINNIRLMPKFALKFSYNFFSDNFSQSVINLIAGKINLIFNMNVQYFELPFFEILTHFGYEIYEITQDAKVKFDMNINKQDMQSIVGKAIILSTKKVLNMLKAS